MSQEDQPLHLQRRIISLLPSATEILFAIGAGSEVVGTTHECDFPPQSEKLPSCTSNLLPPNLSAAEIDTAVKNTMTSDPHSIYALNEDTIRKLQPTVIVTQSLCAVCAVPQSKVEKFACTLSKHCQVVAADPHTLPELFGCMLTIGRSIGHGLQAKAAVALLQNRLDALRDASAKTRGKANSVPKAVVLEWPDPPYAPGHWVPDQIEAAGGICVVGTSGQPSYRISWDDLRDSHPSVIICAFCGYDLKENERQVDLMADRAEWTAFVKGRDVYATNASAYFSRPGNRLIDGAELLAFIFYRCQQYRPHAGSASLLIDEGWQDLSLV